jgi:uncharacterized LabA/DUF88 family protein
MPIFGQPNPLAGIRRAMLFIDGGYLSKNWHDKFKEYKIEYINLIRHLVSSMRDESLYLDLIRVYYYDARHDEISSSVNNGAILQQVKEQDYHELRFGRLKKGSDEPKRQKGVDILLAIDMLSKAYENQYDIGLLLAGDDDFLDLVKAVKDAGKRIHGAYFPGHVSHELKESFDKRISLSDEVLKDMRKTN